MNKKGIITVALFVIARSLIAATAAYAGQPPSFSASAQWSRTAVTKPEPAGNGCYQYTPTGTTAVAMLSPNGKREVYSLPIQLKLINTATAAFTVCASQDPSPYFNRSGYFGVDSDVKYAAGNGICTVVPAGVVDFFGVFEDSFKRSGASNTYPPGGGRVGVCTNGAPCNVSNECQGTDTCTATTPSLATYIFAVAPGGSSIGVLTVCEVQ